MGEKRDTYTVFKLLDKVRSKSTGHDYIVDRVGDGGMMVSFIGLTGWFQANQFELIKEYTPLVSTPTPTTPSKDPVHRPSHYTRFKIEPIYFIMENNLPFWAGNVIKYTCRHDAKNGIEDLKKARRYLDMQIKKMEGNKEFAE